MKQSIANVSTRVLTQRVNGLLNTRHSESYISRVKHDRAGSASLRRVVHQEEAEMLREVAQDKAA